MALDTRTKIWTIISRAAKGIVFWQYRAERVGNENNLAGLVNLDGSFNNRSIEAGEIGKIISSHQKLFGELSVQDADVAILYDFDSSLISQIEDTGNGEDLWDFSVKEDARNAFNLAHRGMYELFFNLSVPVDYLDTRNLNDILKYRVIYAPYLTMIKGDVIRRLEKYVSSGGILLADEGFGLRQQNTWLCNNIKVSGLENLVPAFWTERVRCDGEVKIKLPNGDVRIAPVKSVYGSDKGVVLADYSDGQPAIRKFAFGKGQVILFGGSVGYSYGKFMESAWLEWLGQYLKSLNIRKNPCDDIEKRIYSRRLTSDGNQVILLFNRSEVEQAVEYNFHKDAVELTGKVDYNRNMGSVKIASGQVACIVSP